MKKNFEIVHSMQNGTDLIGWTRISRKKSESCPFEVRRTEYKLRVSVAHTKGMNVAQVEAIKGLLELAWDQMAIRSSTWLLDTATDEKSVHSQLGPAVKAVKDGDVTTHFTEGKLELGFEELYRDRRPSGPVDPKAAVLRNFGKLSPEEKKALLKELGALK